MLYGRDVELSQLAHLLERVRESQSGVLVLRGEPGVGKSALVEELVAQAGDMRVLRATGIEAESEVAFAGLDQIVRPLLDLVDEIPAPQAAALRAALGLGDGAEPDRFLISVAVLSLLAAEAEKQPLLCVIDDAQWLDEPSGQTLTFTARRLDADPIALVFAAREGEERRFEAPGLPELQVSGLGREAAETLLADRAGVQLSSDVRDRVVQSTGGNPLALIELPELLTEDQLAGREPLADPLPVGPTLEAAFLERARGLSHDSQTLLLMAAADDTGDPAVVLRGAQELQIHPTEFAAAESAGLVRFRDKAVEFRHPLVRSAIYQGATLPERQEIHEMLADILEGEQYADRRAWHRAAAAPGPNAQVAEDLESSAERARRRGGYAAAAATFERAAALTPDDEMRARRLYAAAQAAWLGGRAQHAARLLGGARELTSHPLLVADVEHLRGLIEFALGRAAEAHEMLMAAATAVMPLDPRKAALVLQSATEAAAFAYQFDKVIESARRIEELRPSDGFPIGASVPIGAASMLAGNVSKGVTFLRAVVEAAEASDDPGLVTRGGQAAVWLLDPALSSSLFARAAAAARRTGAVGSLPLILQYQSGMQGMGGQLIAAATTASDGLRLARETGQVNSVSYQLAVLARIEALRGNADECRKQAAEAIEMATASGLGFQRQMSETALADLDMTEGRPDEALTRLEQLSKVIPGVGHPLIALYSAPELVEAAVRAGRPDAAREGFEFFESRAEHVASPWALAALERCRALLSDGEEAEGHFEEALRHHEPAGRTFEHARTQLLYGEFLRRTRRRKQAREQLRAAHEIFEQLGVEPWAGRAGAELRASGETARRREPSTIDELTRQELQIAQYVAEGLTNRQVAAQLFLSPRTIDFHLRNVFRKLGITSRNELGRALSDGHAAPARAPVPAVG